MKTWIRTAIVVLGMAPGVMTAAREARAAGSADWAGDPSYYLTIHFPDVNGDGKPDVCGRGVEGIWCGLSTGGAFATPTLWSSNFSDAAGWLADEYYQTLAFVDVNGDGKVDVCGRGVDGIYCALSTGSAFATPTQWSDNFSNAMGWGSSVTYYLTIRFVDVNGDGKADVCGRGVDGIVCALNTGSAFGTATVWNGSFSDAAGWNTDYAYFSTIQFPDVDGDGKHDVCGRGGQGVYCARSTGSAFGTATVWNGSFSNAAGWNTDPSYYSTIQFPDVDGDGKADVCGRGGAGVYCGRSTGSAFGSATLWDGTFSNASGWGEPGSYYYSLEFPDVDGDGKADVCGRGSGGIVCARSSGSGFGTTTLWAGSFSDANEWDQPQYFQTIQYVDLDGDRKKDVCARGSAGIMCALSTGTGFTSPTLWTPNYADPPPQPTSVRATPGLCDITLTWSASPRAQTYEVYRSNTSLGEGSAPYAQGLTTTTFTDSALSSETEYYIVGAVGEGESYSLEVSATVNVPSPTGLTATVVGSQVELSWTAAPGATSTLVYRQTGGTGGSAVYLGTVTGTTFTDTTALAGMTYGYYVTETTVCSVPGKSNETQATLPPQVQLADLLIPDGLWVCAGDDCSPNPTAGEPFLLYWYTCNAGGTTAGSFTDLVFVDGVQQAAIAETSLESNQCVVESFDVSAGLSEGEHPLEVDVDAYHTVPEGNWVNNVVTYGLQVDPPPQP